MDNNLIGAEFLVIIAVITGDEVIRKGRVPLPSRYFFAGVAFAILGIASPLISTKLANVLGLGIVLAVLYQLLPANETPATDKPGVSQTVANGEIEQQPGRV